MRWEKIGRDGANDADGNGSAHGILLFIEAPPLWSERQWLGLTTASILVPWYIVTLIARGHP